MAVYNGQSHQEERGPRLHSLLSVFPLGFWCGFYASTLAPLVFSVLSLAFSLSWLPGMTSPVPMLSLVIKVLQGPEFYMSCQDFLSSDSKYDTQSPIGYFYWEMLKHLQASLQNSPLYWTFVGVCVFPTAKYITTGHLRVKVQKLRDYLSVLFLSKSLHPMSLTRLIGFPEI